MRRLGHIFSIALITAGAILLAEVAITLVYKEPISSVYGSIKQGEAADELEEIEAGYPGSVDRDALAAAGSDRERLEILADRFAARAQEGKSIGRLIAPAIDGLDIVVVQGTDKSSLEKGPGHYPETPFPGQGGTIGIAGHRTTYLAPFRQIDSVEKGDVITMKMPYGSFVYQVQATTIVKPKDIEIIGSVGYERLVLSACHPLYSAAERYIVFARLIDERLAPDFRG
ncbi:MAG TPA: class E sortase [Solirubrobacterales bacterium]|nr:class E sortase [Solirubrobacterales bacterium]